ncbi:MAG: Fic family protein [Acidimicrobiia bacterium]
MEAEIAEEGEISDEPARRVVSNLVGLRDAMETSIPARAEDILRWHRKLMTNHPTMAPQSIGAFRTQQSWIGGDASGPRNAEFIPPRPEEVPALIEDLVMFSARTDMTPVAHASIAHARFEVIHPFTDGNGRVGRMLFQQLLRRRLDLTSPLPVSVFWSQDTDRYIAGLRAYQSGDIDAWLVFASLSIIESVNWMKEVAEKILILLADFRRRVDTRGESVTARVIEDLPEHPIVDTQSVAARYAVAPQSAHSALIRLEDAGILGERGFARRRKGRPRRVFAPNELIDLLT